MKKLFLLCILANLTGFCVAQSTYGITKFKIGVHYAINSTWLMNNHIFNDGKAQDLKASFGSYYGLFIGTNFTESIGLELGVNMNTINQKYDGGILPAVGELRKDYDAKTTIKTTDIPLLVKFGETAYFEIGPMVQLLNKATYNRSFEEPNNIGRFNELPYLCEDVESTNITDDFYKTGFGICAGFGGDIDLTKEHHLKLNIGARIHYLFSDMNGVNALMMNREDSRLSESERNNFNTNPLYGGIKLGLVYCFF